MNCLNCQSQLTDQIIYSHTFCPQCEVLLKIVDGQVSHGQFESVPTNQLIEIAILA